MQQLFQSAFLQSLGYAIASSLWQAALVWLLYSAVSLIPRTSASVKYRLAVAAQLTGFVWFLFTFRFYFAEYTNKVTEHNDGVSTLSAPGFISANATMYGKIISWLVKGELLLPYVSMAYLLLIVFLGIRWIMGYRKTQLIRRTGTEKMPAHWRLFVQQTAEQLGIQKKVQVFLSHTIGSPLTIGFWKPVILVPLASINHLSTEQMEAVLLHELAHIRRWDYLVNMVLSVVEISLFFNPFTQLLGRSIHKERENSCDDWVLQFQYEASDYAKALLCIATLQQTPALAMAATGKKNELLTRVKRMIGQQEQRFNYRRQLMALLIMTGILSSIAWLTPVHTTHNTSAATANNLVIAKKTKDIQAKNTQLAEPMAVSVDNPLYNPIFFLSKPLKAEINKSLREAKQEMEQSLLKEPVIQPGLLKSLPDIVAGALEQAGNEMAKEKTDQETFFKEPLAQLYRGVSRKGDSASLPEKIRLSMQEEISKLDMKKINADIRNARIEVEKAMKEIALSNQQKQQMKKDISLALQNMDELKKLDLANIIINSLDVAAKTLTGEKTVSEKKQAEALQKKNTEQEEKDTPLLRQPEKNREKVEENKEESAPFIPVRMKRAAITTALLDSLAKQPGIDPLVIARMKWIFLQQKKMLQTFNLKFVPAIHKIMIDSLPAEQIIIQMQ